MSMPKRITPGIDPHRLKDLQERLDKACEDVSEDAEPIAKWEMTDKRRLGMTFDRHRELLFSWRDFLRGESSNSLRPGPDHDSWKAFEKNLQSFDHYESNIEDIKVHFIWERASTNSNRKVIPLLLLHGWPSSIVDFFKVIHPLAHPGDSAPAHIPAFDIIVPSQTGYLWSSSPKIDDFGRGQHSGPQGDLLVSDQARILATLMASLGYRKYAIQAGDWAANLTRHMARMYPNHINAVHLNFCPAGPPCLDPIFLRPLQYVPKSIKTLTWAFTPQPILQTLKSIVEYPIWRDRRDYLKEPTSIDWLAHYFLGFPKPLDVNDRGKIRKGFEFTNTGSAYANMHGSRSSTIGLVLQSDPRALLAWIGEKLLDWTDEDPSNSEIAAILTLYWCTDTMPRSIYSYRNRPPTTGALPITDLNLNIKQPFGMSDFPFELIPTPLDWMKRTGNLKWYRKHDKGGHFIALEKPEVFVKDVRDCFEQIW